MWAPSAQQHLFRHANRATKATLLAISLSLILTLVASYAHAETTNLVRPRSARETVPQIQVETTPPDENAQIFHLEVVINGQATNLIGAFQMGPNSDLSAQRSELRELGLDAPGDDPAAYVKLAELSGVTYTYDESTQKVEIQAPDSVRVVHNYDARNTDQKPMTGTSDFGMVVNYDIYASGLSEDVVRRAFDFSGVNLTLDSRIFGPMGTFSQSAILGSTTLRDVDALRLDTTWNYSDQESQITYRAGDVISGGLAWTRSIRLGGAQMQRDFALRPDLVTIPLPKFSGSAALPSTVDVYVNNLKAYSQQVESGPFEISNLPVVNSTGAARIVLNDAAGRQTTSELPFYVSPRLLREGLLDFSAEVGFPRYLYGLESWKYDSKFAASASLKYGLTDDITLEAHSEFSQDLANAGVGLSFRTGDFGVASLAVAGSYTDGNAGALVYAAYDTEFLDGIGLHLSTQRTFGDYDDLASTTGITEAGLTNDSLGLGTTRYAQLISLRPPKAIDTASLSVPIRFDNSSLSLSYVHVDYELENDSHIIGLSYSRPLWDGASAYVSAFADLGDTSGSGVFAGVSIPLGGSSSAIVGVASNGDNVSPSVSASKSLDSTPGSYGWRVDVTEGDIAQNSAAVAVRTEYARVEAGVRNRGKGVDGTLDISGAIAAIGGDVFATNRIDDAFAVVDTGYADTQVLYENRPAGRTGSSGKLLVPGLRAYQKNLIAVDPLTLPMNVELPNTAQIVAPANRAGVSVNMRAKDASRSGLVVLTDAKGEFLAPGTAGTVTETGEAFVVGYDGQAYIAELKSENTLVVAADQGSCSASYSYRGSDDNQSSAAPVVCQ